MSSAASSVLRSPAAGLRQPEAEERLQKFGPNDPSPRKRGALLAELARVFLNPLVITLLVAFVISVAVGQVTNATIILVIAMLSVAINFVQTYWAEISVRKLREHVSLAATVLRDETWLEVRRENVVPGDLVRLSAGDLVPADGFLVESRDLYVQHAALTGESMPAEKQVAAGQEPGTPSPDAPGRLNTLGVVVVGLALPWSPLAGLLGFTPLPLPFFFFLGLSTITYLLLVEIAKRKFFAISRRHRERPAGTLV